MRRLPPFHLERYFAHWEFNVDLQFSASDCESLSLKDLMERGSQPEREEVLNQWLGYTETPGAPALREGIAQLYDGLNADDILVLAPSEGIFLGLQSPGPRTSPCTKCPMPPVYGSPTGPSR